MNLQFYIEKLKNSEKFKKFMKENKGAFLCSGFFVKDLEGKDNRQSLDFFIPYKKKMVSFQMDNDCQLTEIEIIEDKTPEKIDMNLEFDFNEIEKLIEEKMKKEEVNKKVQKYLFSLQSKDKGNFLVGTVFISMLGLIKVSIDLSNMKIVDFEKKSFFDVLKVKKKED